MSKDFKTWGEVKTHIQETRHKTHFKEREIWWCTLGLNIGYEQDGDSKLYSRPVVILKKFNLNSCLIVPLTSKDKRGRYYFPINEVAGRPALAIMSQIRFVDANRLTSKIGTLQKSLFQELLLATSEVCLGSTCL